ncbi:hypothetical protein DICSQDRAFT_50787 [Dichomitus squalens LYAD-421 SS1]|uniref:uncharacterized protein n=1 Tax=Dichomitus squalens (strain LYAD-421) TaxID=732165 RepID=UPI0004414E73|nr:uncharacterized protein DICSQDRAFT_50787 [Dichomitus squalens LYAD-421 SS1]EJF65050.1 hypothetical protein DICSQDRAFT_50787 [Dichomitus squalens LYAD-421 SS1]
MSVSPAHSPSPAPSGSHSRHASTPLDKQRAQLEKLLKDPSKPAHIPAAPKEKTIRPPREMMKNVQGSSAGAGSGEFHVYKASRRREYERLKLMEEQAQKEAELTEFEKKKREWEEAAEAKTAKNRAKRQKKKERAKGKGAENGGGKDTAAGTGSGASGDQPSAPFKKRRLVSGKELVFRQPSEEGSDEEDDEDDVGPMPAASTLASADPGQEPVPVVDAPRITIIEDD